MKASTFVLTVIITATFGFLFNLKVVPFALTVIVNIFAARFLIDLAKNQDKETILDQKWFQILTFIPPIGFLVAAGLVLFGFLLDFMDTM